MKKSMLALVLAFALVLSLAACAGQGNKNADPNAAHAHPSKAPMDKKTALAQAAEPLTDTVADPGQYFKGKQCMYSLPEGMISTAGIQRNEDLGVYVSSWVRDDFSNTLKMLTIAEHDIKITDFQTLSDEQWWDFLFVGMHTEDVRDLHIVNTMVDGCPAIRMSVVFDEGVDSVSYREVWAIDAPRGCIVFYPSNTEFDEDREQQLKWGEEIVATFLINR